MFLLVGAEGFEPPAPCSQSRCSTGLSHAPKNLDFLEINLCKNTRIRQLGKKNVDIAGNKYRLVAVMKYSIQRIYIRFIGTHQDYDKINVNEV